MFLIIVGQKITEVYFTDTCLPYIVKEKKGELPTNVLSGYVIPPIQKKR